MAIVYRAWDTQEHAWRAIKVLLPEYAQRATLRIRFANEAQTMLKFDHRHLVTVFDVGMNEAQPFIVMEIAEGGCVIDWVEEYGAMPSRMAVDVVMQVCKGLGAAHAIGVVHRDIKPHNILITRRGVCQITDFGIAQVNDLSGVTKPGSVMGTLGYMAPEQRADAKNVNVRADVYGLGATLYKLLTGGSVADLFLAEHDANMLEGVPAPLVPILLKATAYKPSQRYNTVDELSRALHAAKRNLLADPENTPSLAMPPRVEGPTLLPRNDVSDPTSLPSELPELRPSVRRSPRSQPVIDEDENEPTGNTSLPYFMPAMDKRKARDATADATLPDYIDTSAVAQDDGGYVVELDDKTKTMSPEAHQLAIKAGRLDEHENPISNEEALVFDNTEGGLDIAENRGGMLGCILMPLGRFLTKALCFAVATLFLVFGAATVMVGGSAKDVRQKQSEAIEIRSALYFTIEREERIVEDLVALGGNRIQLSALYFAFTDTEEEPERADAAMRFVSAIESAMPAPQSSGQTSVKLHMAKIRLNTIMDAQLRYQESMIIWEEAADTPQGRAAIKFGFAHQP
ncbi:MAG: protein kinase [Rhodobacterales bacterium]|nr:protein kinase [Rhodobacterales bacterium]